MLNELCQYIFIYNATLPEDVHMLKLKRDASGLGLTIRDHGLSTSGRPKWTTTSSNTVHNWKNNRT